MSDKGNPFIASCKFCEQGLIRIARCTCCDGVVAICDECEAVWSSPQTVAADPESESNSQHPACPHCEKESTKWTFPSAADLEELELKDLITGHSK